MCYFLHMSTSKYHISAMRYSNPQGGHSTGTLFMLCTLNKVEGTLFYKFYIYIEFNFFNK
jgi:hypothetical protein